MRMRFLGNTGVKVSEICMGTMTFSSGSSSPSLGLVGQKEADILVSTALDAGVNFFDTADIYSRGESEEILGKALGAQRARPSTGAEGLIGQKGPVRTALTSSGQKGPYSGMVLVAGELWQAQSDEELLKGDVAVVMGVDGVTLKVSRADK